MTPDELLAAARAEKNVDRALELYRQLATAEPGPAWSIAQLELVAHEHNLTEYKAALDRANKVLALPALLLDPGARAAIAILACSAHDALDQPVDFKLLRASIDEARDDQPYYAGVGLALGARHVDGAARKAMQLDAVKQFDRSSSWFAAPNALLRLATWARDEGNHEEARMAIDAALQRLAKLPYLMTSGAVLRDKLIALRDSLA